MRLIRSELMKIRTTNIWWLFGLSVLVCTAFMHLFWSKMVSGQLKVADLDFDPRAILPMLATELYTSGQYFNILFVLLLSAIVITNEFYQQTATATFLTTPKRTRVILAKLATAVIVAGLFFTVTTAINLAFGAPVFMSNGYDPQLGEWQVQRSILMNGLAFALWAVLGVGLGVLIRNQIGTVITATVAYLVGTAGVAALFQVIRAYWIHHDWVFKWQVLWPSSASRVMIMPDKGFEDSPPWWVGALVLAGYGLVFGIIGTLITRKRDIS